MDGRENRWVILLAGGNGSRLRGRNIRGLRFDRPKQFCRVDGDRSLLRMALERAGRITAERRILPVVCDAHRLWWEGELRHLPEENVLSQPANRGSGAAIFHALFQILRRDRNPMIAVLPSDHAVDDEDTLHQAVDRAASASHRLSGALVLLGMNPEHPEPQYGWILPAPAAADATRRVEAFFEKPSMEEAQGLMKRGALWNSFIFAASALGLLRLFDEARPDLLEIYPESMLRRERDAETLGRYYARLPEIDFSRDVLSRSAHRLRVLPVEPCGWTDLGTPERVCAWLDRQACTVSRVPYGRAAVCEIARI